MAQATSSPFYRNTRRGPARTKLGGTATEDASARNALRFLYAHVLDVFATAKEYPEDPTYTADWLTTFAADGCEIPRARARAVVWRILAKIASDKLRGNASRARSTVRELLAGPGLEDDDGRRVRADVTDLRARRILKVRNARSSGVPTFRSIASGAREDGTRWQATLYRVRPRGSGHFLNLARVRLHAPREPRGGHVLIPTTALPDGRIIRDVVREWSRDRARTEGERRLARLFLGRH